MKGSDYGKLFKPNKGAWTEGHGQPLNGFRSE